jgi:hypothetical protein
MKQVLILLFIVIWGILQARRKAMREQQRKQAQQDAPKPSSAAQAASLRQAVQQVRARQPAPLGAVSAEENQSIPLEREDRSRIAPETTPEEIRSMLESTRRSKRKKREAAQAEAPEERVEEIVAPAPSDEAAYETVASVRRRISFDTDALRTFVVTREVLGPPRFRKPHRPGVRWR